jgi:rare lipoprotein A
MAAAHRTLPFGTRVRVTDLATGNAVTVRINDRGPYVEGRCIDLTSAAADALGITKERGIAKVKLEVVEQSAELGGAPKPLVEQAADASM